MKKLVAALFFLTIGIVGCATNNYEKAYKYQQESLAIFQHEAGPIFEAILSEQIDAVGGFETLHSIAKRTRPDDWALHDVFYRAGKDFAKVKQGSMSLDQASTNFTEATIWWQDQQRAKLSEAARLDAEAQERINNFMLFTAIAGQSMSQSYQQQGSYYQSTPYIYVNPYLRNDGTYVNGHFRTAPNYTCLDNLGGC